MRVLTWIFGSVLLLALSSTALTAEQIKISIEERSPDGEVIGSNTIYADEKSGVHLEFHGDGQHGGIIYSKAQKTAWMVDYIESTYFAITEEDAAKIRKMQQEAMPMMAVQKQKLSKLFEEQMEGMSEEEKRGISKFMPGGMGMGMGMDDEEEEVVYEEVGSEEVDQWGIADIYEGRQYGDLVEKVWTVGLESLGVNEAHLQALAEIGEFMGGFMDLDEDDQGFSFAGLEGEQGYPGFAVKREIYDGYGDLESTEIATTVEIQQTDSSKYRLPTDPELNETQSPFQGGMPSMGMPPQF